MSLRTNVILAAIGMAITLPACGLIGVEPDEIDILETGADETGGLSGTESGGTTMTGDGDGDPTNTGDGDGDGDGATGDGDGDPATGDGDGDATTGDGDGDATTTTGETGDPCSNYFNEEDVLDLGDNDVTVTDAISVVDGSCGSDGPDAIYAFTAGPDGGDYTFTLTSGEFDGALYLVGELCDPVDELACELEEVPLVYALGPDETVFVVVDATIPGAGNILVTTP